ncbi:hypothetical protein GCM10023088_49020 [Actinomadura verrucosospora]
MTEVKQVLPQQLSTAWALFEYHAPQWHEDDLFWEPAPSHWTMHQIEGGCPRTSPTSSPLPSRPPRSPG